MDILYVHSDSTGDLTHTVSSEAQGNGAPTCSSSSRLMPEKRTFILTAKIFCCRGILGHCYSQFINRTVTMAFPYCKELRNSVIHVPEGKNKLDINNLDHCVPHWKIIYMQNIYVTSVYLKGKQNKKIRKIQTNP